MSGGLVLALPSKGRLQEETEALLTRAGLGIEKADGRTYRGRLLGLDRVEIAFLSATEIARELAEGSIHLGVTGQDLVRENIAGWEARIALLSPLGFGRANVVVAVPELWIDVWTMEDLDDIAASFRARHGRRLRIATKYWNLTQLFFLSHGIALYRIVESLGATEGAPAAGLADAIVDITTTGSTLAANHLKVLEDGVILRSEAYLARSLTAVLDSAAEDRVQRLAEALGAAVRK
jgi:ATP phosphoribosyltransferase